jgi:hypothetical protein
VKLARQQGDDGRLGWGRSVRLIGTGGTSTQQEPRGKRQKNYYPCYVPCLKTAVLDGAEGRKPIKVLGLVGSVMVGEMQEARGKGQKIRGRRQETRGERQEARGKR